MGIAASKAGHLQELHFGGLMVGCRASSRGPLDRLVLRGRILVACSALFGLEAGPFDLFMPSPAGSSARASVSYCR